MEKMPEPSILIVGAGPTGLSLAISLLRFGVSVRLIDKASAASGNSKALVLHRRTTEILDCLGLQAPFVEVGHPVRGMAIHKGANPIATLNFEALESPAAPTLVLSQSEVEKRLIDELHRLGGTVEFSAELLGLKQEKNSVRCKIQDAEKVIQETSYAFVAGCDGSQSAVRNCLGFESAVNAASRFFGLADVEISGPLPIDQISFYLHEDGELIFVPIRDRQFRVLAKFGGSAAEDGVSLEEMEIVSRERTGADLHLSNPTWLTGFRTHDQVASRFSTGRTFLVGDAAHNHHPATFQGLNAGIQDAINLGWKLALVARGDSPISLLDSYHDERFPTAIEVHEHNNRLLHSSSFQTSRASDLLRRLPFAPEPDHPELCFAKVISQFSANYRASPLTVECRLPLLITSGPMKAGERLPNVTLIGPGGKKTSLYEWVRTPGFHLFLSPGSAGEYGSKSFGTARFLAERLQEDFRGRLSIHWLLTPAQSMQLKDNLPRHHVDLGGAISHALGLEPAGLALIRPDYYAAFTSHDFDWGRLRLSLLTYWT